MTYLAVRAGNKPADEEHHYGHGKVESLAALVETALLFLLSGVVAWEGVRRLSTGSAEVEPSWIAAAVLVGAILVDAWRWRSLKRVARETGSQALEADALHFSSDLVNSVLVLGALAAAAMGFPQADALVAIAVSGSSRSPGSGSPSAPWTPSSTPPPRGWPNGSGRPPRRCPGWCRWSGCGCARGAARCSGR
jgi:cation diffusion facilitator family transporter